MTHWPNIDAHPGEFLKRRFLEPLGIAAIELARATGMPRSRVSELLSGKRSITADTALRLAAFFGMEPEFWMHLQSSWELSLQRERVDSEQIASADMRGFLVGPQGAQRMEQAQSKKTSTLAVLSPELMSRLKAQASKAPQEPPRKHVHVRYDNGQHAWISTPE